MMAAGAIRVVNTPSYEYRVFLNAIDSLRPLLLPELIAVIAQYAGKTASFKTLNRAYKFDKAALPHFGLIQDTRTGQYCFPEFASVFRVYDDADELWNRWSRMSRYIAPLDATGNSRQSIVVTPRGIFNASARNALIAFETIVAVTSNPDHSMLLLAHHGNWGGTLVCSAYRLQEPRPVHIEDLSLDERGQRAIPIGDLKDQGYVALSSTPLNAILMYPTDVLNFRIWHIPSLTAITTVTVSGFSLEHPGHVALGFSSFIFISEQNLVCEFEDDRTVAKG